MIAGTLARPWRVINVLLVALDGLVSLPIRILQLNLEVDASILQPTQRQTKLILQRIINWHFFVWVKT